MRYQDRCYGTVEISEPVLVELLESPTLQRLTAIDQVGYAGPFFPTIARHSRLEHSVGVWYVLQRFGAPLDEQVAGLIHDVSHAAFSHCIDYVLNLDAAHRQDHQDNVFPAYVRRSAIPRILQRHGLDLEYILDDRNFPLKEQPLPDLCADRLDYSLRTAVAAGELNASDVAVYLDHLRAEDGRWVFTDYGTARRYAELFLHLNTAFYAGLPSALMFATVGGYLRHALEHGYLTEDDCYATDAEVLAKIAPFHARDEKLQRLWDRMNGKIPFTQNPRDSDARVVCKSRVVDPWCRHHGKRQRVSAVDPHWAQIVKRETKPKEYWLKFAR